MFKTQFTNNLVLWKCISFLIVFVIIPNRFGCAAAKINITKKYYPYDDLEAFKLPPDWSLAPLGASASEFLGSFFVLTTINTIKETIDAGITDSKMFVNNIIIYSFIKQIPMTIVVSLGLLGVCLLLLMPGLILLHRKRQITASEETEMNRTLVYPKRGWIIYEFLVVFLGIVSFGGIIMCLAVTELHDKTDEIRDFAKSFVNKSYDVKEIIRYNFHNTLSDISRNAFESVRFMHDVNDEVKKKFIKEMEHWIKPVRYLAKSILWDTSIVQNLLKNDRKKLSETEYKIDKYMKDYLTSLRELKKVFEHEEAKNIFDIDIDNFELPGYNFSNSAIHSYDQSIEYLEEVLKVDLNTRQQNISDYLRKSVDDLNFDPSPILEELRTIVFNVELSIRTMLNDYIHLLEISFKEEHRQNFTNSINTHKQDFQDRFRTIYDIVMIFSIMGISLGLFFLLVYSACVIATKGFLKRPLNTNAYKFSLSNGSGKLMLFFIYFTPVFLACFWALSLFIFVVSIVPFEVCLSSKDKTLFAVTIDHKIFRQSSNWYSMYSSSVVNSTMSHNLISCEKDRSFFLPLSDPILNKLVFNNLKYKAKEYTHNATGNGISNIPYANTSNPELSTSNMTNVLHIEVHAYVKDILEIRSALQGTKALIAFNEIKRHSRSSAKLSNAANEAANSYAALDIYLSNVTLMEHEFNSSIKSLNITVEMLIKQIEYYLLSYDALIDYLQTNSTNTYTSILTTTLLEEIDDVTYNMNLSVHEFRKSISFCPFLLLFYEIFLHIMCNHVLYPLSACWFGSFFVAIFFVLALFLCLYSLPLFLAAPKFDSSNEQPSIIQPHDIPSRILGTDKPFSEISSSESNRTNETKASHEAVTASGTDSGGSSNEDLEQKIKNGETAVKSIKGNSADNIENVADGISSRSSTDNEKSTGCRSEEGTDSENTTVQSSLNLDTEETDKPNNASEICDETAPDDGRDSVDAAKEPELPKLSDVASSSSDDADIIPSGNKSVPKESNATITKGKEQLNYETEKDAENTSNKEGDSASGPVIRESPSMTSTKDKELVEEKFVNKSEESLEHERILKAL